MSGVARRASSLILVVALCTLVVVSCPGPEPQLAAPGGGATGGSGGAGGGVGGGGGVAGSGGTGPTCVCENVDLLFVVDNTHSMYDLIPVLMGTIGAADALHAVVKQACSYHVGVVTSRPSVNNPVDCRDLGALSRINAMDEPCEMQNGMFITDADEADFMSILTCLLSVELHPSDGNERPIEAMFAALGDAINAAGGCNEGFHRPGAPLVTVIVSDVDDETSPGQPDEWFADLVALKGDPSVLATVGLLGPEILTGCPPLVEPCPLLRAYVDEHLLDNCAALNICSPSTPDLEAAVGRVWQAICPEAGR